MRKINVGCAQHIFPEPWENVDLQTYSDADYTKGKFIQADAITYDYTDAEYVFAGHFLEHLTRQEGIEWIRKVRFEAPASTLLIAIPAIDLAVSLCDHEFLQQVASYPDKPYDPSTRRGWHASLWRTHDLLEVLTKAGYTKLSDATGNPLLSGVGQWQFVIEAKP